MTGARTTFHGHELGAEYPASTAVALHRAARGVDDPVECHKSRVDQFAHSESPQWFFVYPVGSTRHSGRGHFSLGSRSKEHLITDHAHGSQRPPLCLRSPQTMVVVTTGVLIPRRICCINPRGRDDEPDSGAAPGRSLPPAPVSPHYLGEDRTAPLSWSIRSAAA